MKRCAIMNVRHAMTAGVVILLCMTCGRLTAQDALTVQFGSGGQNHRCTLSRETVLRGPDWTPGSAPAPLSAQKAVQIALQQLAGIVKDKDVTGWEVSTITTSALQGTDFRKWYYQIYFIKPLPPDEKKRDQYGVLGEAVIFVNMDGTPGDVY